MLRGDNVICGTVTAGTGTLTLAAPPGPPGGIGFAEFLKATGIGFVSGNAVLVSYTIIEYTNSTFAIAKSHEKGVGTLTIGTAYGGGTPHTLARTTLQTTATALDAPPATQNISPATGISIVTAANALVFIGVSSADTIVFDPYVNATGTNSSGAWPSPLALSGNPATGASNGMAGSSIDYYYPFVWPVPMLVKRLAVETNTATTGTTNLYGRIYAINSSGQPGKLLIDFGVIGTGGSSLNAAPTAITSALHSTGFFLIPGVYFLDIIAQFSTGGPALYGMANYYVLAPVLGADQAANIGHGLPVFNYMSCPSGTLGAAPDPANVTTPTLAFDPRPIAFALKAT